MSEAKNHWCKWWRTVAGGLFVAAVVGIATVGATTYTQTNDNTRAVQDNEQRIERMESMIENIHWHLIGEPPGESDADD